MMDTELSLQTSHDVSEPGQPVWAFGWKYSCCRPSVDNGPDSLVLIKDNILSPLIHLYCYFLLRSTLTRDVRSIRIA